MPITSPDFPSQQHLDQTEEFKVKSEQRAREILLTTREQWHSPEWYSVWRYHLAASRFGEVYHRKPDTRPDALVLRRLKSRRFMTPAIE